MARNQSHAPATAQDVRERLADRRSALALLQGEHDAFDEQRSALLLSRSLGEPHDAKALLALTEGWQSLGRQITEEEITIKALERLLATWEGAEQERELAQVLVELQEIHAAAPGLEAAFLRAIDAHVEAAGELLESRARFDQLMFTFDRLRQGRDVVSPGLRSPCRPFPLPEVFTTVRPGARINSWPDYRDSELQYRPDWRFRNPPVTEDPASQPWWQRMARSTTRERFQVLRGRLVTNPGRAIPPESRTELVTGVFMEMPAEEASWLERDSPGTLVPVEAA